MLYMPALLLVGPYPRWPRRAWSGRVRLRWLRPACLSSASGTTSIAALTSTARCSTVGCRSRATYLRLRPSSDEASHRPVIPPSTSSPTKRRCTRVHPHLGQRRQAHGDRFLQPGHLNQSLRTESRLRQVAPATHARSQEFRLRQALVPRVGRIAVDRTWLRRTAVCRGATRRGTKLRACSPHRRHCQPARPRREENGHQRTKTPAWPSAPTDPTPTSENQKSRAQRCVHVQVQVQTGRSRTDARCRVVVLRAAALPRQAGFRAITRRDTARGPSRLRRCRRGLAPNQHRAVRARSPSHHP
jgi:hypothetical protein